MQYQDLPKEIVDQLVERGQSHLLKSWNSLDERKKNIFFNQIQQINFQTLKKQQENLLKPSHSLKPPYSPFLKYSESGCKKTKQSGKDLLALGAMGCLLVAGGQGTRLGFKGAKGKFPVSVVRRKSLFQLFAEKVDAAGKQVGCTLPIAIMTSPSNHLETVEYFEKNHLFGLEQDQLSFFCQDSLPFLDEEGRIVLDSSGLIAIGPAGNGSALAHFVSSGIYEKWARQGVRYLNFVVIDNPLADPFDAELLGFHVKNEAEVTIKCTLRQELHEKVGLIVEKQGNVHIIEYSEMAEEELIARDSEGQFKHRCANLSLLCFSMSFVLYISEHNHLLPWHFAKKSVDLHSNDRAWKCEKFIFDVLPFAKTVNALLYPREQCFAPLKNATGNHSLTSVQRMLQEYDRSILEKEWKAKAPPFQFELAAQFYYPSDELKKKFNSRTTPLGSYIDL